MNTLTFTTTGSFDMAYGFGCASLGLPGLCDNESSCVTAFEHDLKSCILTGNYEDILLAADEIQENVYAAIVLFGNAGGENKFLAQLQKRFNCPMVGGGAAIDAASGRSALVTGNGQAAVMLIVDDSYTYRTETKCIHDQILGKYQVTYSDPRTLLTIDGQDAAEFLRQKKEALGLAETDFEHLTLSDLNNVNAHLSCVDGVIKSGRDVCPEMILRYVRHEDVYPSMHSFYNDKKAIVFGCAGLSGLLDKPLDTESLGLFLFGEVCHVNGVSEFGNLMLSKLVVEPK